MMPHICTPGQVCARVDTRMSRNHNNPAHTAIITRHCPHKCSDIESLDTHQLSPTSSDSARMQVAPVYTYNLQYPSIRQLGAIHIYMSVVNQKELTQRYVCTTICGPPQITCTKGHPHPSVAQQRNIRHITPLTLAEGGGTATAFQCPHI